MKHAQEHDNTILYIALGVAAVAGIAIAVSQGDDDATPAPPVTTTATA